MNNWLESWAKGGRIWTAERTTKRQIAIGLDAGKWYVSAMRLQDGKFQKASFTSQMPGMDGLDECLEWARQLLINGNDPAFDFVEARQTLLNLKQ
jgi:hypothetical protein